jgi:hypothetical protein
MYKQDSRTGAALDEPLGHGNVVPPRGKRWHIGIGVSLPTTKTKSTTTTTEFHNLVELVKKRTIKERCNYDMICGS